MIKPIKKVLEKTPLEIGNLIAWIVLAFTIGFAIGWAMNGTRIAKKYFFVAQAAQLQYEARV